MSVEPSSAWTGGSVRGLCERGALGMLVGAMALLPLQGVRVGHPEGLTMNTVADRATGILVSDVLLVGAASLGLVAIIGRGQPVTLPRLMRGGLVAMGVGGSLGVLAADDRATAFGLWLRLFAVVAVAVASIWGARPSGTRGRCVAMAYLVGATSSAIVGAVAVRSAGLTRFETPLGRAIGLAGNSGALAVVSVIGLALAVVLALETPSRAARAALAVVALALGLAVLDSGSRGALLAVGVLVVVVLVRLWRAGQRRAALAGVAVAVAIAIGSIVGPLHVRAVNRLLLLDDLATNEITQRSTELRLEQYRLQLRARGWPSLVVGSGLQDREPTDSFLQEHDFRDPHNGHFEVWLGMGLLGLAGWGLVAAATMGPGVGLMARRHPLRGDEPLLAAVSTAYLTFFVLALTVTNVSNRYVWILVAWSAWLTTARGMADENHGHGIVIRGASRGSRGVGTQTGEPG